jgi:hypothetical protein
VQAPAEAAEPTAEQAEAEADKPTESEQPAAEAVEQAGKK